MVPAYAELDGAGSQVVTRDFLRQSGQLFHRFRAGVCYISAMEVTAKPATTMAPKDEALISAAFAVELDQVVRRFGQIQALSAVSLSVRTGEFFSLLGPS